MPSELLAPAVTVGDRTPPRGDSTGAPVHDRRLALAVLLAGVLGAAAFLWQGRGYVPMWDARIYAVCVVSAAAHPFSLEALRCGGHPSEAYMGVLSLVQRLDVGSAPLLHLTNALLLALAAVAFARLLRRTFPVDALAPERALLVAALLLDPAVLSTVLHVNVDTGVLVFLLCAVAALAEGRVWLGAAFGLLASYSKETGALLYAALAGVHVVVTLLPRPVPPEVRNALAGGTLGALLPALVVPWGPWSTALALTGAVAGARVAYGRRWRSAELRALAVRALPAWPLFLPPLVYGAHLVWSVRHMAPDAMWAGTSGLDVARSVLTPQVGPISRTYLALILVLNFHWVMSAVIGADLLVGLRRYVRRAEARPVPGAERGPLLLVTLFGAAAVYLVTRFETLVMARYMVPVFPYLLTAFLAALLRLRVPAGGRRGVLAAVVLLLAWSVRRTPDPVSRALWGTYALGRHELLHVNSFAGTCCGYGLNQAIYNLEFLRFADVMQAALDRVQPIARGAVLALPGPADWLSIGPLDEASRRRLVPGPGVRDARLYRAEDLATWRVPVDNAWLLEVAYFPPEADRARLARLFEVGPPDSVWVDGYGIAVRRLTRRADVVSVRAPNDPARR